MSGRRFPVKLNMRVNATQLRILILSVNLLMALGVPSFALYGFLGSGHLEPVVIVDVDKLKMKAEPPAGPSAVQRIGIVQDWLIQKAEKVVDNTKGPGTTDKPTDEGKKKEDGTLDPGPLGESWEYVFYILRGNPIDNLV